MSAAVEVNEARVWATGQGADWWAHFRIRHEKTRITLIRSSIGGELVSVACDDLDDAQWLARHMIEHAGLPKTAVKVRRMKAAS